MDLSTAALGVEGPDFGRLAAEYRARWPVDICLADADGGLVFARPARHSQAHFGSGSARRDAIREGLRWGEPTICQAGDDVVLWAVPVLLNARLAGGVIARASETWLLPEDGRRFPIDLRAACEDLRRLAERANLTNAALLRERRAEYLREQKRAEAIHEMKASVGAQTMIETYLREEPALLSAIRQGDRRGARGILNRVLLVLYSMGGDRIDLVKSFVMELVVTMCRTAVECGGAADELLGANYARLAELARVDGEEDLAHWLVQMLEGIMDSLERRREEPSSVLAAALRLIDERYAENLSRDDVARAVDLSPSHFSRFLRYRTGRSFTDLVNQARIDRACELLRRTERGIVQIALDVGYSDQSYFTKVFRRYVRETPRQYRLARRPSRS